MTTLTLANSVFLMSAAKPIFFLLVLGGWAWAVAFLDADAGFYYLKRESFGLLHVLAGVLGFGLILLVPVFWVGLPMGVLVLAASVAGYVVYRNGQVPENEKWTVSMDTVRQKREQKQAAARQAKATLTVTGPEGEVRPVPQPGDEDAAYYLRLDQLLSFALPRNANQIDLSVDSVSAKCRVHIDGVRYPQEAPEPTEAFKFIDYIKGLAGMDAEDRRKKQDAYIEIRQENQGSHNIHVVSAGSTKGIQVQLVIDPAQHSNIPLKHLGLLPAQLEAFTAFQHEPGKAVLVAAPPHHGAPTTLYSFMHEHDPYTSSLVTLEDEVQFDLEGVSHNLIQPGQSASKINEKLATLLRADPTAIMVSRVIDPDMAALLAQSAPEARVYVPIPQEGAFAALQLWLKVTGKPELVAEGLGAVIAQRLVRRLCHTCRVSYTPDPSALKKLNLPATKVGDLFRASGKILVKENELECPDCHGLGYRGRVGVFEVMMIDDTARKYIAANQLDTLRLHLRKHKMLYLQESALAKVVDGTTDIQEVTRVMSSK